MLTLSTVLGVLAVASTAPVEPNQARHVFMQRSNTALLRGVSITGLFVVGVCSVIWLVYGMQYAWACAVAAAIDAVCIAFVSAVLVSCKLLNVSKLLAATALLVLIAVACLFLPATVLGALGATVSTVMHLPQAVRTWRNVHDQAAVRAFSRYSVLLMFVGNSIWIAYGLALRNVWVALPCVVGMCWPAVILYAQWVSRKRTVRLI